MLQRLLRRLTIQVAHRDAIVGAGVAASLASMPDFEVLTAPAAAVRPHAGPEIAIVDYDAGLSMARAGGGGSAPLAGARVVLVTARDREREIRDAIACGVHGYLLLDCSVAELAHAVRTVASGRRYLTPAVAEALADGLMHEPLTAREAQVLELLASGLSNKLIARALDISLGTVKVHVKAVLGKLKVESRTQAAGAAVKRGLVGAGEPWTRYGDHRGNPTPRPMPSDTLADKNRSRLEPSPWPSPLPSVFSTSASLSPSATA